MALRKAAEDTGTGMSGMDWAGIGMQLGGALLNDQQARRQQQLELEREDQAIRRKQLGDAADRRMSAQEWADKMRLENRAGNQRGLEYLTGLVGQNQQMGRRLSFRDALLAGGAR